MTNVEDRVERALHVLAERIEPDVAAARARLGSRAGSTAPPARRILRPSLGDARRGDGGRRRCRLAVGGRHASRSGPRRIRHSSPPDPSDESVAGTVPSAPSSSSSAEPPTAVVDPLPDIPTPERLAVLDPQPGVAPIRSDPVLDWVHGTTTSAPRRWFIRRSADGTPTGGVSVSQSAATEWATTFHDAPSAGIRALTPGSSSLHRTHRWGG